MLSLAKGIKNRVVFSLGQMAQETGICLDQHGCRLTKDISYLEPLNRHRSLQPIYDSAPLLSSDCYISGNCSLVGEVYLGSGSVVSYGASLRGDHQVVRIGESCYVGENTIICNSHNLPVGVPMSTNIGNGVQIGAMSSLTSCIIDDYVRLGSKTVVGEGATICRTSEVTSNSYVAPGTQIPAGQLWSGSPAQFVRDLTAEEIADNFVSNTNEIKQMNNHYTDFEQEKTQLIQ